jgi:hypothetical protein
MDYNNEFEDIETQILESADTFKLTLSSIRRLDKARSNKFILPLDYSNGDYDKFNSLIAKPFSFLRYNNAHFSVSLDINIDAMDWESEFGSDEIPYYKEILNIDNEYKKIEKRIIQKEVNTYERIKSLNKAYTLIDEHIKYIKTSFAEKTNKFKNQTYMSFLAERSVQNIMKLRESEKIAKRKIEVLKNSTFLKNPKKFFERAVKLYLGKTGQDIIDDMNTLGYQEFNDYKLALKYLFFLISFLDKNNKENKFNAPVLIITDRNIFDKGFEDIRLIKLIATHMFFHTIHIRRG